MEYSDKILKLISRFIEDLINNTMKKGAIFAERYFLHKGLNVFRREWRDALTKEADQLYRQFFSDTISIQQLKPQ